MLARDFSKAVDFSWKLRDVRVETRRAKEAETLAGLAVTIKEIELYRNRSWEKGMSNLRSVGRFTSASALVIIRIALALVVLNMILYLTDVFVVSGPGLSPTLDWGALLLTIGVVSVCAILWKFVGLLHLSIKDRLNN